MPWAWIPLCAAIESLSTAETAGTTILPRCRALHSAVAAQQKACIQYLAAEGADVNGQDHKGSTPLHIAACEGKLEYAKLLISLGASCASKDHM